jgi:hypothetical protein
MLLSWPPHRGERTSDAQAGSDERVPARAVPPLSSPLASSTHSTAPLDRTLKAAGRACTSTSQPPCRSSGTRSCPPRRGFRVARLFMLGTGAPGRWKPKIQHPPLLLGYLQETHKWLLVRFSADRDTKATLRSLDAKKAHIFGQLSRDSTRFY